MLPDDLQKEWAKLYAEKLATYKRGTALDQRRAKEHADNFIHLHIRDWVKERYDGYVFYHVDSHWNRKSKRYDHTSKGVFWNAKPASATLVDKANHDFLMGKFGDGPFDILELVAWLDRAKLECLSQAHLDALKAEAYADLVKEVSEYLDLYKPMEAAARLVGRHGLWDEFGIDIVAVKSEWDYDTLLTEAEEEEFAHRYGVVYIDGEYLAHACLTTNEGHPLYDSELQAVADNYLEGRVAFGEHVLTWESPKREYKGSTKRFAFAA